MAKRGELTPTVQAKATELFGRPITQVELRLIPYVAYILQNGRELDQRKINEAERDLIADWIVDGYLMVIGDAITHIDRKFYDAMNELIWLAYVTYKEQPDAQP